MEDKLSPRRGEIKVRKDEMKLRKNEIKVPKNCFVARWRIFVFYVGICDFLGGGGLDVRDRSYRSASEPSELSNE